MSTQAPTAVVMIRPHHFQSNTATASDNAFQTLSREAAETDIATVERAAYQEVTTVATALADAGITVHLFEDETSQTPDSVFPNNWFSTHAGGRIAVYPMCTDNRRKERRPDILEMLKAKYRVQEVIDYSGLELDSIFLEGTGAMVLDSGARVAYVSRSQRADPIALERFCTHFGYEPMAFDALDPAGRPIYHTNVMMCIATDFALVGLELIPDPARRAEVAERLREQRREVVALDYRQICEFAGNALELDSPSGRILALSTRALRSLRPAQIEVIEASCRILALDIPTIETAGGSVRCMLAGVHLDRRPG